MVHAFLEGMFRSEVEYLKRIVTKAYISYTFYDCADSRGEVSPIEESETWLHSPGVGLSFLGSICQLWPKVLSSWATHRMARPKAYLSISPLTSLVSSVMFLRAEHRDSSSVFDLHVSHHTGLIISQTLWRIWALGTWWIQDPWCITLFWASGAIGHVILTSVFSLIRWLTAVFQIRIAGVQTRSLALHDVVGVRVTRFAKVIVVIEMDSSWMLSRWSTLSQYIIQKKKKKRGLVQVSG